MSASYGPPTDSHLNCMLTANLRQPWQLARASVWLYKCAFSTTIRPVSQTPHPSAWHLEHLLSSHSFLTHSPYTQSFNKMRSTTLTALFFALFALFSGGLHSEVHAGNLFDLFFRSCCVCCASCSSRNDQQASMHVSVVQECSEFGLASESVRLPDGP